MTPVVMLSVVVLSCVVLLFVMPSVVMLSCIVLFIVVFFIVVGVFTTMAVKQLFEAMSEMLLRWCELPPRLVSATAGLASATDKSAVKNAVFKFIIFFLIKFSVGSGSGKLRLLIETYFVRIIFSADHEGHVCKHYG